MPAQASKTHMKLIEFQSVFRGFRLGWAEHWRQAPYINNL